MIDTAPNVLLGNWIRQKRRSLRMVPSHVANETKLPHSAYAEVELGIVRWLDSLRLTLLSQVFCLNSAEAAELRGLHATCSKAPALTLDNFFSKDDLAPVRLRTVDNFKSPSKKEADELLDAVLAPLP